MLRTVFFEFQEWSACRQRWFYCLSGYGHVTLKSKSLPRSYRTARGGRRFKAVLSGGASVMGDNRAILEYRRTLRLRLAEYEREMLIGYRLAREIADCGLVQAGLRLETALAGLQRELGLVRSHLLVLENIAEHPPKPAEGNTG